MESTGSRGRGRGWKWIYIHIYSAGLLSIDPRRMWRPTELTPKEREKEREDERVSGDARGEE